LVSIEPYKPAQQLPFLKTRYLWQERKVHDLVAEMWAADIAKSDDFGKNKPSNMMLPIKKRAKV
jgi:hypothetical protein